MKRIYILLLCISVLFLYSCNENKFLDETPLDFLSGDNAYKTKSDFNAAITDLYYLTRLEFYCDGDRSIDYLYGTDLMYQGGSTTSNLATDFSASGSVAKTHWDNFYKIISQANVVLNRIGSTDLPDSTKNLFIAKAKFFRGFAYRTLCYLYGGVPISLNEVTSAKTDYTRASKDSTLIQAQSDLKFAAENLPDINKVEDGEISAPAAYTLLAEVDLAREEYQQAVKDASKVIDNSFLALMTERFGTRKDEPGDVYWDLFRRGNQNRSAGNTEGIWVIELNNVDKTGGGSTTNTYFWTTPGNYLLERHCAPQVGLFKFYMPDGSVLSPFNWPIGDYTGGRGIGNIYPDPHFSKDIWKSDWNNDIRNSNYNFVRKFKFNNSDFIAKYSKEFGDSIDVMNPKLPNGVTMLTGMGNQDSLPGRYLAPYQTKCTTPYNHPDGLYLDKSIYELSGTAGGTYCDQYMIRLPEAYLLRAEAYLKLNDKQDAANDINIIRHRAHASDVEADKVTMDYILDERMREFGIEEKRRLTLSRTGLFYDRITKYNPWYNHLNSADGKDYSNTYSLYPIPTTAIEANKDAVLTQNPGY
ncbi:MAG TPA: RagB/SusD family nutrient uptake outer membrane protein [Prevotella sp.]|jgi:hypothetical protein|nr:RagB/SusD family nutrient uptake outer membrane protein [Prevotella sp.]